MAGTTPLSDAVIAFCRGGGGGIQLFPTTLEDAQTATPAEPFVLAERSSAMSAVMEPGVSLLDVAGKCAMFWGEEPTGSFAGDLAKTIVARSAPLGRVRPQPPAPGPYTLVEWYGGARVLLPMDFSDDRSTVLLPEKRQIRTFAGDDAGGLSSLLVQKSTARSGMLAASWTKDDLVPLERRVSRARWVTPRSRP
jgi:hypothetical protein